MCRPMCTIGNDRADIAAADDAQRLVGDLDAHEAVLLPLAGLRRGVGLRDLAGEREHQRDGVLGGGDRVAERRVHHDHALGGGGRDIDVVDADAGAADHLEVLGLLQELGGDLGGRADRQPVELADQLGELLLVGAELGLEVDLDAAVLEDLHGGIGEGVGDENSGGHGDWSCFTLGVVPAKAGNLFSAMCVVSLCAIVTTRRMGPRLRGDDELGRLCQRVLGLGERPVEPERERLDVVRLHGRAAPDAQAGRRVAVGVYVVGDALLFERGGEALHERGLRVRRELEHRRIDHLQADRGVGADRRVLGEKVDPGRTRDPVGDRLGVGVGARNETP